MFILGWSRFIVFWPMWIDLLTCTLLVFHGPSDDTYIAHNSHVSNFAHLIIFWIVKSPCSISNQARAYNPISCGPILLVFPYLSRSKDGFVSHIGGIVINRLIGSEIPIIRISIMGCMTTNHLPSFDPYFSYVQVSEPRYLSQISHQNPPKPTKNPW